MDLIDTWEFFTKEDLYQYNSLICFGPIWITADREEIPIVMMHSAHLFNAVRMLFNHCVPPEHATGPHKKWHIPISAEFRKAAMVALLQELTKRRDLSIRQLDELGHMADTVNHLLNGRMPPIKFQNKRTFDEI